MADKNKEKSIFELLIPDRSLTSEENCHDVRNFKRTPMAMHLLWAAGFIQLSTKTLQLNRSM